MSAPFKTCRLLRTAIYHSRMVTPTYQHAVERVAHARLARLSAASCCRDCVVYSATCDKLNGASVVLKVYDKAKISAIKHRSVRREARIMRYLTEKG